MVEVKVVKHGKDRHRSISPSVPGCTRHFSTCTESSMCSSYDFAFNGAIDPFTEEEKPHIYYACAPDHVFHAFGRAMRQCAVYGIQIQKILRFLMGKNLFSKHEF